MFVSLLLAGALLTDAVVASPAPVTVPAKPAPAPVTYAPAKAADQKDDQMVCKSEAVLGSRLPVRRCHTVGDIKDRALQDQQAVERAQANLNLPSR
jgi:hypothetical protein